MKKAQKEHKRQEREILVLSTAWTLELAGIREELWKLHHTQVLVAASLARQFHCTLPVPPPPHISPTM